MVRIFEPENFILYNIQAYSDPGKMSFVA